MCKWATDDKFPSFSLINDKQMSNKVGVEHQPEYHWTYPMFHTVCPNLTGCWWLRNPANLLLIRDIVNIYLSPFSWLALDEFICTGTYKYSPFERVCFLPSTVSTHPGYPGGKICLNSKNFTSPGLKTSFVQSSETWNEEKEQKLQKTIVTWAQSHELENGMITGPL